MYDCVISHSLFSLLKSSFEALFVSFVYIALSLSLYSPVYIISGAHEGQRPEGASNGGSTLSPAWKIFPNMAHHIIPDACMR